MNTATIPDWLRPILGRIVASIVAGAFGYLARKGIDFGLTDAQQAQFSEGILAIVTSLSLAAYAAVHRAIAVKISPMDAASPALASVANRHGERAILAGKLQSAAETPPIREFNLEASQARDFERERLRAMTDPPPNAEDEFTKDPTKPPTGGF